MPADREMLLALAEHMARGAISHAIHGASDSPWMADKLARVIAAFVSEPRP